MFCATCGTEVSDALNYCKNCGARIAKENDEPTSMLNQLLTTLTFVLIGGLGILVGLSVALLKHGVDEKAVAIIAVFYLASLTAIAYMLLGQLPKIVNAKLNAPPKQTPEAYQPPQLAPKSTAQLEEPKFPVMSVTDVTTRNFEKVPRGES